MIYPLRYFIIVFIIKFHRSFYLISATLLSLIIKHKKMRFYGTSIV